MGVDEELIQAVTAQADDILRAMPELLEALLERQRRLQENAADARRRGAAALAAHAARPPGRRAARARGARSAASAARSTARAGGG